ncbi:MAG: IS4 family transposase [Candidatus Krumholzibacteria bacterium]|nr:IS4 family transposase [Candidatus Krumholzibacteria bacterium]
MESYSILREFSKLKSKAIKSVACIVSESKVEELFDGHTYRERLYHIWPLFQLWLYQSMVGGSCRETVAWGMAEGLIPPWASPKTAAYCNARSRLPEEPLWDLVKMIGRTIEDAADKRSRPFRREVVVVDGTSVQLPDTAENQGEYPQPKRQKPGCGQPVMSLVALMGLVSGAILDLACGGGLGHERALFRELWPSLKKGQIVLADSGFCSYGEVAKLLELGVDVLMCQTTNSLENKELIEIGRNDYIVIWKRGKQKLEWTERDELPEILVVRAIEFETRCGNGMTARRIIFTSLLDTKLYPREKLIELYRRRWEVEISFDDIKTEMGMALLKCKTPKRCRSEILMGLIAYNIIRGVMLDAARKAGLKPREISFKGTMQRLDLYFNSWSFDGDPERAYNLLLNHLAIDRLVERPGRWEPRMRKRRPHNYSLLTKPRNSFNHAPSTP